MISDSAVISYSVRYFVDREEELKLVLDKVHTLLDERPVRKRTTAFYGPRGSGKSWLLQHIHHLLQEFGEQVCSLMIVLGGTGPVGNNCFCVPFDGARDQPQQTAHELLVWTCQRLDFLPAEVTDIDELSTQLVSLCRTADHPLILLADGIDEVPYEFLRTFEDYFLVPMVQEPNVLVVLGGRVRSQRPRGDYRRAPELKIYSDLCDLTPFDENWTRVQFTRLNVNPDAAPEVRRAGGGFPLNNFILGQDLQGEPLQWQDKAAALQSCAEEVLSNIDSDVREYFWPLCVLRAFDEDRMPPLLAVWFEGDETSWDYQTCRRIREDVVATRLARWSGEKGYVMDEAVCQVLENALHENRPECWYALHQAAYELYKELIEAYPSAEERWQPEAEYHKARLLKENDDGKS